MVVAGTAFAEFQTPVALTNVRIVSGTGPDVESGTIVIDDGRIITAGASPEIPANARRIDMTGLIAYPGFIDAHSHLGIADKERTIEERTRDEGENPDPIEQAETSTREAGRRGIRAHLRGAELYTPDAKSRDALRRAGFTAALIAPRDGILAGSSDLVSLGDEPVRRSILAESVAQHSSFTVGEPGEYPRTILGVFAVFRQTLLDARWHARLLEWHKAHPNNGQTPATDADLDALQAALAGSQPVIFTANSENEIRRALDLGKEFGLKIIISGGQEAWKVADRIKAENVPVIVRLKFDEEPEYGKKKKSPSKAPEPRDAEVGRDAERVPQPGEATPPEGAKEQGEQAKKPAADTPTPSPSAESEKKDPDRESEEYEPLKVRMEKRRLWEEQVANVIRLHEAGIPFALSTRDSKNPEEFVKNLRMVIEKGLPADAALAAITRNPAAVFGMANELGTVAAGQIANLTIMSKPVADEKSEVKYVFVDGMKIEIPEKEDRKKEGADKGPKSADSDERKPEAIESQQAGKAKQEEPDRGPTFESEILADRIPRQTTNGSVLIKNVTLLPITASPIEKGFLLISKGKIQAMGTMDKLPASVEGTAVIDGQGWYAMPGIVDPHSHLGIDGVNESPNAISAEVRIADTIDPFDLAIYRALAGGVTTHHAMHGSANPIGGQNVVFKLKYRRPVSEMVVKDAPRTIKFALGENVVQANFPTNWDKRYPVSRMGVESVIRTAFESGRAYSGEWDSYKQLSASGKDPRPLRRDLRLEAMADILAGDLLIHSHCYRSEEILRLLAAAEDYGVRVALLHHVLEGYRIAPEIARHGCGASSFANDWAYKVEAYQAIPHNAALMTHNGVHATLNSDSPNTIRFMAQEAAKTIKWGGLTENEALKLVTLHPAEQLRIDRRVGSLEVGKDGDVALFNGHPLDTFSKCVMTIIEGDVYFEDARPQRTELAIWNPGPAVGERVVKTIPKSTNRLYAITNATIHPMSGPVIDRGTLLIFEDKIQALGADVVPPAGAGVIDGTGLHVYPGLIDAGSILGLNEIDSLRATRDFREIGIHNPDLVAANAVHPHSELIPIARAAGITTTLAKPAGARVAGQSSVIRLNGWTAPEMILVDEFGLHLTVPSLPVDLLAERRRGPGDDGEHLCEELSMGLATAEGLEFGTAEDDPEEQKRKRKEEHKKAMSELEEFMARAKHYSEIKALREKNPAMPLEIDLALEAMIPYVRGEKPVILEAATYKEILDALAFAQKHKLRPIVYGGQESWKLAGRLAKENVPVILATTLSYPRGEFEPWDSVYRCAGELDRAGVAFAFASDSASAAYDLPSMAGMAVAHGLPREKAEYAMTLGAAKILGIADHIGSLEAGKVADVIVTTGSPAQTVTVVTHLFMEGRPIELESLHTRNYVKFKNRPAPKLPPARGDLKGPKSLSAR